MDGKGIIRDVKIALLVLCLGGLFFRAPVLAATIGEVSVTGIKRTKPHVAEQPLRQFIGRDGGSLDLDEVRAAVMDTGILEPVSVEVRDTLLLVEVEEKWSILPLPLFFADSGGISAGAALLDTNSFGLRDTLLVGGLYGGEKNWLVTAMYLATPDRTGLPGWTAGVLYESRERRDTDQRDQDIRRFPLNALLVSGGLIYAPTEHITLSLIASYNERAVLPGTGGVAAGTTRTVSLSPELSLRRSQWDGFFLSQTGITLNYTFIGGISSPSFHTITLGGTWERSILPGFRGVLKGGGRFAPDLGALFESPPATAQLRIMPRYFSVRHYAGASLGLEKYLLQGTAGTLSVLATGEFLYSRGPILGDQVDYGVTGSLCFYLNKLALPALSVGFAYNIAAGYPLVSFSAGISF
jgi:hypothetical protein